MSTVTNQSYNIEEHFQHLPNLHVKNITAVIRVDIHEVIPLSSPKTSNTTTYTTPAEYVTPYMMILLNAAAKTTIHPHQLSIFPFFMSEI